MSAARAEVLARIRAALGADPQPVEVPRTYTGVAPSSDPSRLVELFCRRVAEYRATVHRVDTDHLQEVVTSLIAERRVVVPAEPPCCPDGSELVQDDPPLSPTELDAADAVLTGCALAVAETGTIVLDGSPTCGRRALTLVPDHHVCVVRADQVVRGVPDAIAALKPLSRRAITLVSGPSATSDIELERVEGVHGPRVLDVVVVAGS